MTIHRNTTSVHKSILYSVLICGLIVVIGCGVTKVSDIENNLDKFKNQQVTLNGKVVNVLSIPVIHKGAYELDDGTGKIWVVPSENIPAREDKVKVSGTVKVGVEIAGKSFGVVLMEGK